MDQKQPSSSPVRISRRVCVVGASGLVGSWLVKKLLERGHIAVHATIRNTNGDPEKAARLRGLPGAESRLHLFDADLLRPDQIEEAIHGCEFVFLVAFPTKPFANDAEMDAAAEATMASLKSVLDVCERSGTVKRVIYTGSVLAASPLDEHGILTRDFLDESCWTNPDSPIPYPYDFVKFYSSVKTASEELLVKTYPAKKKGHRDEAEPSGALEVVVLCCGIVGGVGFGHSAAGFANLLSPFTGEAGWHANFLFGQRLLCSVPLVHLDDACEAHIFSMDVPLDSSGAERFLCATGYPSVGDIIAYYKRKYPELIVLEPEEQICGTSSIRGGSSKLREMGFEYKYSMEQILDDMVAYAKKSGLVKYCRN